MGKIGGLLIDFAPQIVAAVTAVLMILELIASLRQGLLRRSGPDAPGKRKRNWILVVGTMISATSFFVYIFVYWEERDFWNVWRDHVESDVSGCRDKNLSKVTESYSENDLVLDCLALSLDHRGIKKMDMRYFYRELSDSKSNIDTDNFNNYLINNRAGSELLKIPVVSNALVKGYGIYNNQFIGSGRSLPLQDGGGGGALDTGINEFLVKNACLEDGAECPDHMEAISTAWGWMIEPSDMDSNGGKLEIGKLILERDPNLNSGKSRTAWNDSYRALVKGFAELHGSSDRFLIRFAQFSEKNYKGSFAQSSRRYAFFADVRQVWRMTYSEAVLASGRAPDPSPNADSRIFIWVVKLDPNAPDSSGLASWDYILRILKAGSPNISERQIKL